jgi:hypothetical protein
MHRTHVRIVNEKIKQNQFIRKCVFDMVYEDVSLYIALNPTVFALGITKVMKMYPLHVKQKLFRLCTSCTCCATHCSNRPRFLDYTSNTPIQKGNRCYCSCRSLARSLHHSYRFPVELTTYSNKSIVLRNIGKDPKELIHG